MINDFVVEIGPGRGAMTAHLLPLAKKLYCIEIDARLAQALQKTLGEDSSLEIITGDILAFPLEKLAHPVVVFGNIPYHISSELIGIRFIDYAQSRLMTAEEKEELLQSLRSIDTGYADWMVAVNYEVENSVKTTVKPN